MNTIINSILTLHRIYIINSVDESYAATYGKRSPENVINR